ncbi:MAG: hypothetical protein WC167_03840 [Bacilli bacterium]|jgi:hypothetical protein
MNENKDFLIDLFISKLKDNNYKYRKEILQNENIILMFSVEEAKKWDEIKAECKFFWNYFDYDCDFDDEFHTVLI